MAQDLALVGRAAQTVHRIVETQTSQQLQYVLSLTSNSTCTFQANQLQHLWEVLSRRERCDISKTKRSLTGVPQPLAASQPFVALKPFLPHVE